MSREDELYDLVEPDPPRAAAPPPIVTVPPSHAALAYPSAKVAADEPDGYFPDKTIDFHLPLALAVGGAVVHMLAEIVIGRLSPAGVTPRLTSMGIEVVVGMVVTFAAVLVAVRFRGIELGRLPTALLKLAAIWLAPGAIVALAMPLLWFIPGGGLIVWVAQFALYFALIGTLFKLDESDTWYVVSVVFVISVAVHFAALAVV